MFYISLTDYTSHHIPVLIKPQGYNFQCSWSWNSNTLATWCKELTHWKRPGCWERWKAGGEGDNRGWDGWMASLTQWTWVWVNSRSWWWTGRPDVLQSMRLQRVGHNWATELNWTIASKGTLTSPVRKSSVSDQEVPERTSYTASGKGTLLCSPRPYTPIWGLESHSDGMWILFTSPSTFHRYPLFFVGG